MWVPAHAAAAREREGQLAVPGGAPSATTTGGAGSGGRTQLRVRRPLDNPVTVSHHLAMATYDIECPLCEGTDYGKTANGLYECYDCNTQWGVNGEQEAAPVRDTFAERVNEKLRKYSSG